MDDNTGTPEAEVQEESLEELKQKFEDQRKRAEKAEAEAKDAKAALDAVTQPVVEEKETPEELPTQEPKIQFDDLADNLSVLKPLADTEVEELRTQAKELGIDPIKFAQSPAWKSHLDNFRNQNQSEDTTPEPSHRIAVFEDKTFDQVVASTDMSEDGRQQAFEAQRDALLKRGSNQNM